MQFLTGLVLSVFGGFALKLRDLIRADSRSYNSKWGVAYGQGEALDQRFRNFLPIIVDTFLLNGGLNEVMFRFLCLFLRLFSF